jgi:hypothetical protein
MYYPLLIPAWQEHARRPSAKALPVFGIDAQGLHTG